MRLIIPANTYSITLLKDEQAYLKSFIKNRIIQTQVVDRAQMLLWKSETKPHKTIIDNLDAVASPATIQVEAFPILYKVQFSP